MSASAPTAAPASSSTPPHTTHFPLLHANINGEVRTYDTSQYPNAAAIWWAMQEEMLGVVRPQTGRVSVADMAAFIRDAVPLKHSHQPR